ncbi:phosphate:acyl-[acyl carrier protein] acyltransferase [Armatimonadetes bacterium GBS]|jgi:glycerol-3-phosphate acyltransferase PlsX|nr:phosphate:acyl-[acyl carrier protein] acyltransferase [Armatimonadetes bacterium GBS]CUU38008.1 phosphate:acyl-[acyl carrier protein] acyltransferase [Armatimonadetes bacterium GXS]
MRIAVDAMGGDYAPQEIVAGAYESARQVSFEIVLVGDTEQIEAHLPKRGRPSNLHIHHASQVVTMEDSPVMAIRRKRDSSLVVAAKLVKEGKADALVSMGNTGAVGVVAKLLWGSLPYVDRPAIATVLPTYTGRCVLLDSGATVDCSPRHLLDFALMGQIYAAQVLDIPNPRVGLLNIGEEATKGNSVTKEAYQLLMTHLKEDFVGNVEGKTFFEGVADVVVCDGFVGNVFLKTGEGVAETVLKIIKEELTRNRLNMIPLALLKPAFERIKRRLDYREYGGAPLLGVDGVCIIGHGRSDRYAVRQAISVAAQAVANRLVPTLRHALSLLHESKEG